jgi:hypothetical protein
MNCTWIVFCVCVCATRDWTQGLVHAKILLQLPLCPDLLFLRQCLVARTSLELFFVCVWVMGLNSGLHTCKAATLTLEPHLQSILLWLFLRWGSHELFVLAGLKTVIFWISAEILKICLSHQSLTDLEFLILVPPPPKSWAYRCAISCLAIFLFLFFFSTGDWTQGLMLARQAFYHVSCVPKLCFGFLR